MLKIETIETGQGSYIEFRDEDHEVVALVYPATAKYRPAKVAWSELISDEPDMAIKFANALIEVAQYVDHLNKDNRAGKWAKRG